jgi:SulP family sulfate permease
LRSVARSARLQPLALDLGDHSEEEQALLREHIVAFRLDGPLFFAAAHHFLRQLSDVADVRVVILRMSRISAIDATGAQVLADAITSLERRSITVLISGISHRHDDVLAALGVATHLRRDGLIFPDTPAAIRCARTLLGPAPSTRPPPAGSVLELTRNAPTVPHLLVTPCTNTP